MVRLVWTNQHPEHFRKGGRDMVVLVRCTDGTVTVAQGAKLSKLIKDGLIKSFLRSGVWVDAVTCRQESVRRPSHSCESRCTTFVSCF